MIRSVSPLFDPARRQWLLGVGAACAVACAGTAQAGSFEDFFTAVQRDDAATLARLASLGFDLNTTNAQGQHALHLAMREPSSRVLTYLIQQPSVNVEARNPKDESPLMLAVLRGHWAVAKALLARGADVNKTGWAPLHYAASFNGKDAVEQVQWLLDNHAYIDAESPNGTTPLMMAAQYGSEEVARLLLQEGADAALRNQLQLTAIDFATRAGRASLAEVIGQAVRTRGPKAKW
ncbi:MAG TPA: ankyrin repeat domain-containing protein [Burkholderiaceae bacterium]|nr:ankyrin repeat domain-containing protein [Burkholderiaceae bacterium]